MTDQTDQTDDARDDTYWAVEQLRRSRDLLERVEAKYAANDWETPDDLWGGDLQMCREAVRVDEMELRTARQLDTQRDEPRWARDNVGLVTTEFGNHTWRCVCGKESPDMRFYWFPRHAYEVWMNHARVHQCAVPQQTANVD